MKTAFYRALGAERPAEGSRGLQFTDIAFSELLRGATLGVCGVRVICRINFNCRSATPISSFTPPWAEAHGYHHGFAPRGTLIGLTREPNRIVAT